MQTTSTTDTKSLGSVSRVLLYEGTPHNLPAAVLLYIGSSEGLSWNALYDGIQSSSDVGEAEAAGRS